ncbi:BON domain-containing protein [Thalassomonas haliotis]|uniref:BON domain-containing protein n=1 Tax=Thalassomonas haliotis TaxID=485448 RepID=A0ABY7VHV4_9GAMM|nr:BON domain-containing protein [Thalassomonas haliotis]WDE12518.1 BON domain-containing protein [Thalassomonas haliotis]
MKKSMYSLVVASMLTAASATAHAENTWKDKSKDAWIDGKAETTLLFNGNLNSFDINTDVHQGVVTLTGKVDSEVDKALAQELIESLDGVASVNNQLTVLKGRDADDDSIITAVTDSKVETVVKTKLLLEPQVSGRNIEVEVSQGEVTLKGEVASDSARQLAVAIAKNTRDVESVIDKLKITGK